MIRDRRQKRTSDGNLIGKDDSRTAREVVAALVDHGLRTAHAATGIEALQTARANNCDAIILDRMSGCLESLAQVPELAR